MVNLEELKAEIRGMDYRSKLYKLLKGELTRVGNWKNRPRGNPKKGYRTMKENR